MERNIVLPMTEKTVRELKLGDIVYLSGEVIQLLAPAHQRAIEYKKANRDLPFDLENMAIYHSYSCIEECEGSLHCYYLGASTSAGVNPYEPEFIKLFKVRAIIGKGGMDQKTLEAMKETGCVYLAQIGGCSQLSTQGLEETTEIFWEDMAANRGIKHRFDHLGPLIVGMDAHGNSLFENIAETVCKNKEKIFKNL